MNWLNILICWSLANVPTLTRPLTNVLSQFRHPERANNNLDQVVSTK